MIGRRLGRVWWAIEHAPAWAKVCLALGLLMINAVVVYVVLIAWTEAPLGMQILIGSVVGAPIGLFCGILLVLAVEGPRFGGRRDES